MFQQLRINNTKVKLVVKCLMAFCIVLALCSEPFITESYALKLELRPTQKAPAESTNEVSSNNSSNAHVYSAGYHSRFSSSNQSGSKSSIRSRILKGKAGWAVLVLTCLVVVGVLFLTGVIPNPSEWSDSEFDSNGIGNGSKNALLVEEDGLDQIVYFNEENNTYIFYQAGEDFNAGEEITMMRGDGARHIYRDISELDVQTGVDGTEYYVAPEEFDINNSSPAELVGLRYDVDPSNGFEAERRGLDQSSAVDGFYLDCNGDGVNDYYYYDVTGLN